MVKQKQATAEKKLAKVILPVSTESMMAK